MFFLFTLKVCRENILLQIFSSDKKKGSKDCPFINLFRKRGITFALHSHTFRMEYNLFRKFTAESDETRREREGDFVFEKLLSKI